MDRIGKQPPEHEQASPLCETAYEAGYEIRQRIERASSETGEVLDKLVVAIRANPVAASCCGLVLGYLLGGMRRR